MPKDINRRSFLKGALATAGAAAATGIPLPQTALGASDRELATMLDLTKCIGCGACVDACQTVSEKYKPGDPVKPFPEMFPAKVPVEDWSERRDVTHRLSPYNWLYIQTFYVEHNGEEHEVNVPRRCMHCQNPTCVNLCPFGAARKQKNGISIIDPEVCLGGSKCRTVCPWHIPQRQTGVGVYLDVLPEFAGNGVMYKCNRCYERVNKGELPACIDVCPEGVQTIGPRNEILAQAHARAKEINGYIYGEHENGGTNTIYMSPVPFEVLNKAHEEEIKERLEKRRKKARQGKGQGKGKGKGKGQGRNMNLEKRMARMERQGRPHLGPVENSMANAENLTVALALAPVAGAFAAWGRIKKALGGNNGNSPADKEGHDHE